MRQQNRSKATFTFRRPSNDLFGLVEPHQAFVSSDGVHFNGKGKVAQGVAVAESVLKCLPEGQ